MLSVECLVIVLISNISLKVISELLALYNQNEKTHNSRLKTYCSTLKINPFLLFHLIITPYEF